MHALCPAPSAAQMFFADGPPTSFLDHYYHFLIEIFSGAWRLLASTAARERQPLIPGPPERIIFARAEQWRDGPGLNSWFLQTVLPGARASSVWPFIRRRKGGVNEIDRASVQTLRTVSAGPTGPRASTSTASTGSSSPTYVPGRAAALFCPSLTLPEISDSSAALGSAPTQRKGQPLEQDERRRLRSRAGSR
jgi:hypothetical protein